jgi:histidyl-tRNA synthetase
MGGPVTPGIGFGIGIERVLIACEAEALFTDLTSGLDAFVIDGVGDGTVAVLVAALRESGLRADRAYGGRSVKAQWKLADRCRAAYGVMVGRAESEREAVAVKNLQTGEQIEVPRAQVAGWIRARRQKSGLTEEHQ